MNMFRKVGGSAIARLGSASAPGGGGGETAAGVTLSFFDTTGVNLNSRVLPGFESGDLFVVFAFGSTNDANPCAIANPGWTQIVSGTWITMSDPGPTVDFTSLVSEYRCVVFKGSSGIGQTASNAPTSSTNVQFQPIASARAAGSSVLLLSNMEVSGNQLPNAQRLGAGAWINQSIPTITDGFTTVISVAKQGTATPRTSTLEVLAK